MELSNIREHLKSQDVYIVEVPLRSKNGKYRQKQIRCMYLNQQTGTLLLMLSDVEDIVKEEKEKQEQLEKALKMAEAANEAKTKFLAGMSHEIRTPMNAIIGLNSMIRSSLDDREQVLDYTEKLDSASQYLLALLNDILDMSRIESGSMKLAIRAFEGDKFWDNVNMLAKAQAVMAGVGYSFERRKKISEVYIGDSTRLEQIMVNLINNAVKFTEQGSITLGYRREAGDLLFYVEDTGKGISEEHLRTVFDRFVKLNSFAQGTGLGLSISKSIVEQMGGHIGVESEEGRGSRFWFTIPAVACNAGPDDEPSVVAEAPHPVSRQDGKLPLLLVAEDTDSNFLLVSLMFRKEFDIVRAVNGEEAVRICREMKPAAILMDIKMPVMDGLEATRRIRAFDPVVPIVAVTAFAYDRDRQKALAAGANEYVAKPLSGEHIRRVLGTLLAGG